VPKVLVTNAPGLKSHRDTSLICFVGLFLRWIQMADR
jgi:hypothetical protein